MKLVMFDFDGVLANTLEFCFKIHKDRNGNLTWEKFQSWQMGNFHELIEKLVKEEAYVIPNNFQELYQKNISVITIHDVLRETVLNLKNKFILTVVSSSDTPYINSWLKKEGLLSCFSDILGSDVHKIKVIKIKSLLEKYKVLPEDAVFITDSFGDVLEANECGVRSVGVTWGIHGENILKEGNPAKIINDPRELLEAIEDVLK